MAKIAANITTTQAPQTDTSFSEQKVNVSSGPVSVLPPDVSLETHAVQPGAPKSAAVWVPMTKFEDDLKSALKNFIDTTMEGVKYPQNFRGRTKAIDFFFSGTATKSIKPSEIGHFRLVFSYPANITSTTTNTNTTTQTA
jgi:hypothetical protein